MTIRELDDTYIEDLNRLGDWFLQYEYLLELAADIPGIPEGERRDEDKVNGCQSNVWLKTVYTDGHVRVLLDSDALIVRGMIAIIAGLFDDRTPEEIIAYHPRFIEETNIKNQISTDRFHGMESVIAGVQEFAGQCMDAAGAKASR